MATQHDPWPGQQQLPVVQQLIPAVKVLPDFAAAALANGSQHDPWPGQQHSPVTQQPATCAFSDDVLTAVATPANAAKSPIVSTIDSLERRINLIREFIFDLRSS
ncbi:MAG: hypothetical protein ACT4QC_05735 [Planctomycetaceae bacterium]